ncbi:MAG: ATP-binding protein [Pseudomonadota bacterium]
MHTPHKAQHPETGTSAASSAVTDFQLSLNCSFLSVRRGVEAVMQALSPLDLDVEECGTVELVLAEAMNNIVEHAYPPSDEPGLIHLSCTHAPDGLHVKIRDAGRPMPDGATPIGAAAQVDVEFDDLPEGGFGWFLIKDLAKDVEYRRMNDENHLTFRLVVAI